MLAKIYSGAVYGIDAYLVEIEVNAGRGEMGTIIIVGLPDTAVRESRDRVWTALINSGFNVPLGRTTINLAPADIKKEGPRFDLPIALGIIAAKGEIENPALNQTCVIGELALSGAVRPVPGVLPLALRVKELGFTTLLVPTDNANEAAVVSDLNVIPIRNLREAVDFLNSKLIIASHQTSTAKIFAVENHYEEDLADIKGQEYARRAMEVAVSGGHNILLIGTPGSGKTMLAKRVPSILPPLSLDEALETTKIHSIAGQLPSRQALVTHRPFRSPHHTISDAGLLGGGSYPFPGEVSLAHNGVLFLDELPEFHRHVLEVMRQPLEEGEVTISRAKVSCTFPCNFMLVAAMNPCPCGYYGDRQRECRCSSIQIQRYRNRISGPLLDRIDIHVEVPAVRYRDLAAPTVGEGSAIVRQRVITTRENQRARFKRTGYLHCNADMRPKELRQYCQLGEKERDYLKTAVTNLNLSARAYDRILKVARTIADLEGKEAIEQNHLAEAIRYRTLDRQLW